MERVNNDHAGPRIDDVFQVFTCEEKLKAFEDSEPKTTKCTRVSSTVVNQLDANYVVCVLRSHYVEGKNITDKGRKLQMCLVMPAAERSLQQIIDSERIAGIDLVPLPSVGFSLHPNLSVAGVGLHPAHCQRNRTGPLVPCPCLYESLPYSLFLRHHRPNPPQVPALREKSSARRHQAPEHCAHTRALQAD